MTLRRPLILALLVASCSSTPSPLPDLSGHWKLNETLSDSPREKLRESMGRRRGAGGGAGGPGPGGDFGGTRGGTMGRGGIGADGGMMPGGMDGRGSIDGRSGDWERGSGRRRRDSKLPPFDRSLLQPAKELTIEQHGSSVVLRRDAAEPDTITEGHSSRTESGRAIERDTKWKQGQLRINSKRDVGPAISESFELSEDRRQLIDVLRIHRPDGASFSIQRIYDRN